MFAAKILDLSALQQLLPGILSDRAQHSETSLFIGRFYLSQQALARKRHDPIQDVDRQVALRVAYRLGGLKGETFDEYCQPPEQQLFPGVEKIVAPFESASKGLLARREIASA